MTMEKVSDYEIYWNLNEVMYQRRITKVTDLHSLLTKAGVVLS